MISLVRYLGGGVRNMEGQQQQHKRQRESHSMHDEEQEELVRRHGLGIRSEILKDEGVVADDNSYGYTEQVCDHTKSFKEVYDNADDTGFGNMLGPGDYRRHQQLNQWNSTESSSLSDYSGKYKRSIASGASAEDGEAEERRVRSRPEASVLLTNLLGRREETDFHMNISARTLRPSGGKDRHSKVFTAKGPRDRRVRLSVSTAIQFYDVQDRLGYDQPSKAVEWLMKKAKNAIDELSQIPLPGLDRLVPSTSSSIYHPYGYSSTENPDYLSHHHHHPASTPAFSSGGSGTSELQMKGVGGVGQGCVTEELDNREVKGGRDSQAVDESDGYTRSTRRGELATDITMSVGDGGRSNQVHHHHHHQLNQAVGAPAGLSSFSSPPMNTSSQQQQQQQQQHRQSLQQRTASSAGTYLYEDPCSALSSPQSVQQQQQQQQQRLQGILHTVPTPAATAPLQYHHHHHHQQTSLITVQQTYLQQPPQDFLQHHGIPLQHGPSATVLPFGVMAVSGSGGPAAKPYLDQFHSLKIATAEKPGMPVASASSSTSAGPAGGGFTLTGNFLGSPSAYSPQKQQQQQQQHIVGGFAAENSQLIHSLEEQQLRGGNSKRD